MRAPITWIQAPTIMKKTMPSEKLVGVQKGPFQRRRL